MQIPQSEHFSMVSKTNSDPPPSSFDSANGISGEAAGKSFFAINRPAGSKEFFGQELFLRVIFQV
jgi:hypothetical protein